MVRGSGDLLWNSFDWMNMRKHLVSVTKDDCEWKISKGSGKGGQKVNKTSNAVHCIHHPSGASGFSHDTRSQLKNRQLAFKKMAETKEFQKWLRLETAKAAGRLDNIDETVDRQMKQIRVEGKENGKWVEIE